MKNKKPITTAQMNRQGIFNLVLGFVVWIIVMFYLKVF
jgi:hypothetical protein